MDNPSRILRQPGFYYTNGKVLEGMGWDGLDIIEMEMKRLRTIEKDFVLKPNPYLTDEQSNSVLWKLAVGELLAISAFTCISLTFLKVRPSITSANSFRNFTYFQGLSSLGVLGVHLYELDQLRAFIPEEELQSKMKTYDQRYP